MDTNIVETDKILFKQKDTYDTDIRRTKWPFRVCHFNEVKVTHNYSEM